MALELVFGGMLDWDARETVDIVGADSSGQCSTRD